MKKILLCSMLFVQAVSAGEYPDPDINVDNLGPEASSSSSSSSSGAYENITGSTPWDTLYRKYQKGPRIFIAQVPEHQTQHHTYGPQTINHSKAPIVESFIDGFTQGSGQTLGSMLTRDAYEAIKRSLCPSEEDKLNLEVAKLKLRQAQNNEAEREMSNNIVSRLVTVTALINTLRGEASRCDGNLSPAKKVELDSLVQERALLQALITPKQ